MSSLLSAIHQGPFFHHPGTAKKHGVIGCVMLLLEFHVSGDSASLSLLSEIIQQDPEPTP
jgi:hypothetical protein